MSNNKTKIVICGSLKQLQEIDALRLDLERTGKYDVTSPNPELNHIEANFRYISAIKNSDVVIVVPKSDKAPRRQQDCNVILPDPDHNYIYVGSRFDLDSNIEHLSSVVELQILHYGFDIGESTLYELCTALSYKKIVVITLAPGWGDSVSAWSNSVVAFLDDKIWGLLDGREED